jgi:hypothetical protein
LPRIKKASFKENYFVKSVERPPSTLKFCPVIHEDWFEIKKAASSAISLPFPNLDIGCSLPKPSATFSLEVMKFDILEYDKLGEIVLNLIFGAKSAAKDTLRPFRALFAEDIAAWFLKPLDAAIEEKNTTEELSENLSMLLCRKLATLKKLLFMTSINSLTDVCLKGFKTIDPRAKIMPDIS